jgi:flagellar hook-length control protein FliK
MNIRGTESTALAAMNDLFVVPTPQRDGAADFQRALQPPRPHEQVKPSSPPQQQDKQPDDRSRAANANSAEPQAAAPPATREAESPENISNDTTAEESEPTAPVVQANAETDEINLVEDEPTEEDIAAESLAAAALLVTPQPLADPPVPESGELILGETTIEPAVPINDTKSISASETITTDLAASNEVSKEKPDLVVAAVDNEIVAPEHEIAALEEVTELLPEVVEASAKVEESVGGIGVLPSAVAPQEGKSTGRSNSTRTAANPKSAKTNEQANRSGDAPVTPELTATEVTAEALPAEPTRKKPSATDGRKENSEATVSVLNEPANALLQPLELVATAEAVVESPATAPAETPVVSELHSTHHSAHDPSKLTTTLPLNNAAINRLPAQAVVRSTPQQQPPAPLHVDAARFLQRVAKAFESARERGGEIRLRLSPPELGALRVEVNMSEQGLAARVEVETNDARTILLENLPALRERLAEQGLRLERFDVELSQREPDQHGGNLPDQSRDRQPQPEARVVRNPAPRPNVAAANQPETSPNADWQDRQLNVIV